MKKHSIGLTLLLAVVSSANAGIIVSTSAESGGAVLDLDSGSGVGSAAASIFDSVNFTYRGEASGNAFTTSSGLNTIKFRQVTEATVPASGNRTTVSNLTWQDTITTGTIGDKYTLAFQLEGDVSVIDPGVGLAERWDFSIDGIDTSNAANNNSASIVGRDTDMDGFVDYTPSGFTSFGVLPNGFDGNFQFDITIGSQFDLHLFSSSFVNGGDGQVIADLGNSITLTGISDSSGNSVSNATFGSGITFSAVPEPASGMSMLLFAFVCYGTRRKRSSA